MPGIGRDIRTLRTSVVSRQVLQDDDGNRTRHSDVLAHTGLTSYQCIVPHNPNRESIQTRQDSDMTDTHVRMKSAAKIGGMKLVSGTTEEPQVLIVTKSVALDILCPAIALTLRMKRKTLKKPRENRLSGKSARK